MSLRNITSYIHHWEKTNLELDNRTLLFQLLGCRHKQIIIKWIHWDHCFWMIQASCFSNRPFYSWPDLWMAARLGVTLLFLLSKSSCSTAKSHENEKNSEACMKTGSSRASLTFIGQVSEQKTVKLVGFRQMITHSWCLLYSLTVPGSAIPLSFTKGKVTKFASFNLDFPDLYVSSSQDRTSG